MDESRQLSSFTHAEAFLAGSRYLCSLDHGERPTVEQDAEECRILAELCDQVDEYQEQSYLLDPSLESMVGPLIDKLRDQVLAHGAQALDQIRLKRTARLLYFLTKVRGAKVVVRFFPHEVSDLICLLSLVSPPDSSPSTRAADPLVSSSWETRYLLLLWLSVCVRLPFDLSRLDAGTGTRIEHCAERWMKVGSKEREGGIELLARYFARQDAPLQALIQTCERELEHGENLLYSSALVETLCIVIKTASPDVLLRHFPSLYRLLSFLPSNGKEGAVIGKCRVKLAGRLALLKLGKREVSCEDDVPEEVEVILGEIIEGLSHPDTIVRWSAAKYLARLTSPLPAHFASTVIDSVLSIFEECLGVTDRAEHGLQGSCFAFGELARRGLIKTDDEVRRLLDGVMKALLFDRRRNMQTIGTSVRDSAAYVLWSLARTLSPEQARPYAQELAERLVCVAVFDREVSIRRAASAAFQEAVGRWGVFPHGIDVLRKIDFFTVSVRHRAYLVAAPSVALHREYRAAVVDHLITTGVQHYDPEIRELAATALGKIMSIDAGGISEGLILQQLAKLGSKDSSKLHGTLLSLAALGESIERLEPERKDDLRNRIFTATVNLLVAPPSARLLKTSHLVLFAALLSLEKSAPSTDISHTRSEAERWIEILHHAGDHADVKVHRQAAATIHQISRSTGSQREIARLLADLDSKSGTRQQAVALMLGGVMYNKSNQPKLAEVVKRLISLLSREGAGKGATVEARQNGVEALASILCAETAVARLDLDLFSDAFEALQPGLADYTNDQRGDVGSWVRAVTLRSLLNLLPPLLNGSSPFSSILSQERLDKIVGSFAKLAVERVDTVREAAGVGLFGLAQIETSEGRPAMKGRSLLSQSSSDDDFARWRNISWASEQVLPLLQVPEYRTPLLEGALLATNRHSSTTPFLDYLLMLPTLPESDESEHCLLQVLRDLHTVARAKFPSNRIFVPFLLILSSLAESGVLEDLASDDSGEGEARLRMLFATAVNSIHRMKAPHRVEASSKVVTSFLAVPAVGLLAAEKVPLFLLHPLTWLRQQTADDLFGVVTMLDLGETSTELESLLIDTSWSADECETEAKRIAELLRASLEAPH